MVLRIDLPSLEKDKTVKDAIISILSLDWPLSLAQINKSAHKNYGISKTYQATFKALNDLLKEKVVSKNGNLYSLNMEWVTRLKEFSDNILKNYSNSEKGPIFEGLTKFSQEENIKKLTFDCLTNADKAWLKIKEEFYKNIENKEISIWEGNHCWWLLVYPEREYEVLKESKKKGAKSYKIVHNNYHLDKCAKKFYEDGGVNFKISASKIESDMSVFGDTIMQINLPEEIKKEINEVYEKCKYPSDVNLSDFIRKVLEKKAKVEITLTKNKDIAEMLKSKALVEFQRQ